MEAIFRRGFGRQPRIFHQDQGEGPFAEKLACEVSQGEPCSRYHKAFSNSSAADAAAAATVYAAAAATAPHCCCCCYCYCYCYYYYDDYPLPKEL